MYANSLVRLPWGKGPAPDQMQLFTPAAPLWKAAFGDPRHAVPAKPLLDRAPVELV